MYKERYTRDVNYYYRLTPEKQFKRRNEFICQICHEEFEDPRVLPCLHCFCIRCLRKLDMEQNPKTVILQKSRNELLQGVISHFSKNKASEYEYIELDTICDDNSSHIKHGPLCGGNCINKARLTKLKCPTCGFENGLPNTGVQDLPPHYLLQHRMLIESLNRGEVCLLCDLCPSEIPATSRCTRCLLNLCNHCSKSHRQEKIFPDHKLMKLKSSHEEGMGITKIRRQAMCPTHPEKELQLYCSTCNQVICTECRSEYHVGHSCESTSRAAQKFIYKIKETLDKTRTLNNNTSANIARLNNLSHRIESKYSQVQREINSYIDHYVDAIEEHRKTLLLQATQIRNGQLQSIKSKKKEVEKNADDINHTLRFGEELLREGSDFEVLSFALNLLQKLEFCIKAASSSIYSTFGSCIGTLQFLPEENAGTIKNHPVFGIVTTQTVSPSHCYIISEGVTALQNCKQNETCNLTLITKDCNDQRLKHGAEGIEVTLKNHSGSNRQIPIFIVDQQNGVYLISFTPDINGKFSLYISIRGVPIRGSPFLVNVQNSKHHKGTYHCCSFCSSGGKKSAICGCGARMPGGYRGCGHGYSGHPGRRHWSCCGSTMQKSECLRSLTKDGFYQLSL